MALGSGWRGRDIGPGCLCVRLCGLNVYWCSVDVMWCYLADVSLDDAGV